MHGNSLNATSDLTVSNSEDETESAELEEDTSSVQGGSGEMSSVSADSDEVWWGLQCGSGSEITSSISPEACSACFINPSRSRMACVKGRPSAASIGSPGKHLWF